MAEPRLWQRAQTGSWYVTLNGKQISLGKDEELARKKYHALLADNQTASDESIYKLLNRHLAWCKLYRKPETFKAKRVHLRRFAKFIGKTRKVAGRVIILNPRDNALARIGGGHDVGVLPLFGDRSQ